MASTTPVTAEAGKGAEFLQAVRPDHTATLGTVGGSAVLAVPSGAAINSQVAPTGGMVQFFVDAGAVVSVRIGTGVTALATDMRYPGPNVWHMPIEAGERISFFGQGGASTATAVMVQNRA